YAEGTSNITNDVDLSFRYRIENVKPEGFAEDALASTLRTRVTLKTKWSEKVDSVIEFDDVSIVGMNDFNSGQGTSPNRTDHPIVADPTGTDLNQAFIRYNGESTKVGIGTQRILIGNQRFVGGVGWRQNEQTYDSLTVKSKLGEVALNYAYVFNVNRIFGDTVAAGDHKHNTHLLNADYKLGNGKLSGYYFVIDNENPGTAGLSNDTFGLRYAGKNGAFKYAIEFASQSGAANNPNDYDADYSLIEGSYNAENFSFGVGMEVLGGDSANGQGFTTSLATLHKFQGWADQLLGTPAEGVSDTYLNGSFKAGGFNFKAIYHTFETDENSTDIGTELNFLVAKKVNKNVGLLLKYASFDADEDSGRSDVDKIWFMVTYKL
ncbi:MAG: alginate export family protein, partial [Kangiellaceae bacterium]|nr:alginate export family protein [Kangiellaceae bacterium]